MIKIVVAVRSFENPDLQCPVLACDTCGYPLVKASDGMALWTQDGLQTYTVHKGPCDALLCKRLGISSSDMLSDELDQWMEQLSRNFAVRVEDNPGVHLVRSLEQGS